MAQSQNFYVKLSMPHRMNIVCALLCASFIALCTGAAQAADANGDAQLRFDDTQLESELVYPDWFKLSLGDLRDDLKQALSAGKDGIVVYFGQKRCAYCKQFIEISLGASDSEHYLREHFDVIAIDIWSIDPIKDTDGKDYTERELSVHYKTNFTPSLIFYDNQGMAVFRLRGYYPPYKFRAALKYIIEDFYKHESFRDYLARAESGVFFQEAGLNERDFFLGPPYNLHKLTTNNSKPLAVFFEQSDCHTCDLLHTGPLNKQDALDAIEKMHAVQFDMRADTPLLTPDGKASTARDWADELGLFYAPTIIFFDPAGHEIMRIDSVVQFYRLWGVLDYMNQGGYNTDMDYQLWRLHQRKTD